MNIAQFLLILNAVLDFSFPFTAYLQHEKFFDLTSPAAAERLGCFEETGTHMLMRGDACGAFMRPFLGFQVFAGLLRLNAGLNLDKAGACIFGGLSYFFESAFIFAEIKSGSLNPDAVGVKAVCTGGDCPKGPQVFIMYTTALWGLLLCLTGVKHLFFSGSNKQKIS